MHGTLEQDIDALNELAVELDGRSVPGLRLAEDEFVAWCPERTRAEWVDGEVILMAPANIDHEDVSAWFLAVLRVYVEERKLGRVIGSNFWARLPGRLRLPDLHFISEARAALIGRNHVDGAPDLVVEVVSPDSRNRDRREKFSEYESAGVREYWIVDPVLRRIDVYVLGGEGKFAPVAPVQGCLRSTVIEGFFVRVEWFEAMGLPSVASTLRALGVL
jgi:Uma2 family endonuclease